MNFKNITFTIFISLFYFYEFGHSNDHSDQRLNPESYEVEKKNNKKIFNAKKHIVVSANKYATDAAVKILNSGGTAADAAVTLQLILGLVEPQSSGLGGGSFALFYNAKNNDIINYDGREKAPGRLKENVFLKKNGERMSFFDAVVNGKSVGVPGTLAILKKLHEDFGVLKWEDVIDPAIKLAQNGFFSPPRLNSALKKEKYLFKENPENDYFLKIKKNPSKIIKNLEYANTLKKISEDYRNFYSGKIASDIVRKITMNHKPGDMTLTDLKTYKVIKSLPICVELKSLIFCGPNLPSSGGISIAQALLIYENYYFKKKVPTLASSLDILDFIYFLRQKYLADPAFVDVDIEKLLDINFLDKEFKLFLHKNNKISLVEKKGEFSSTSHFSIVDSSGNVISMTSSIENSFGSRLFLNGFLLNNQLTDFSFLPFKNKIEMVNKPQGGKKPLSSMSPIIILDKKKKFIASIGSPGGTAIISYVFKTIVDIFYNNISPMDSIISGNYIKKNGKTYLEKNKFYKLEELYSSRKSKEEIIYRKLASGIGVIIKNENGYIGFADTRRDGTSNGK
ncbi:MAG: gamma-glutamyltransferase [Rickettsiales bacterium]|nr:gamma-glutamyltransferase [Rickettsiales bacterium]